MVKIMLIIKWFYLASCPISQVNVCHPSDWMTIDRTLPTLNLLTGLHSLKMWGDLKLWDTYNTSYIPWVIVKTTVSDETNLHAGW